ncbi:hypothetical protein LG047_12790 [Methylocystis sp. WRRC1]|uniref:XRE family transcriptional regulator n=1 Tax=unclassified Methylocystis TaxID=2625913 RepID=UPI00130DC9AB|nr:MULTISPECIES: S24 family peptidase [unclassified Methylocystis]MCC3246187.1 hypothetical protein [Methylocystis sp. WRRC1]
MRRKVPPEHLAEFARRVCELTDPLGSVANAARILGVPDNTLRRARAGENEPQAPLLLALSEKLGVSMSYLLGVDDDPTPQIATHGEKRAPETQFAVVPHLDVRAAAGPGSVNHIVAVKERLAFPAWMLHKLGAAKAKLAFMRASGDSMLPTIADGALLLVNESETDLPPRPPPRKSDWDHPDIYVFGDEPRVKRLRRNGKGEIVVISDNLAYDPEILRGPELKRCIIHGRVIWWDNRL